MNITATAIDSFAHGAKQYASGDPVEATKSTAEDLRKAGLVAFEDVAPQTGVTDSKPADDDLEDLVGGDKAEAAPKNKMQPAPANKGKK